MQFIGLLWTLNASFTQEWFYDVMYPTLEKHWFIELYKYFKFNVFLHKIKKPCLNSSHWTHQKMPVKHKSIILVCSVLSQVKFLFQGKGSVLACHSVTGIVFLEITTLTSACCRSVLCIYPVQLNKILDIYPGIASSIKLINCYCMHVKNTMISSKNWTQVPWFVPEHKIFPHHYFCIIHECWQNEKLSYLILLWLIQG